MKNKFAMCSVIASSFIGVQAFAATSDVELACRDVQHIVDEGFSLVVKKNYRDGDTSNDNPQLVAFVYRNSYAGPRLYAKVDVEKKTTGTVVDYTGVDFSLNVNLESVIPTREHYSTMNLTTVDSNGETSEDHIGLICSYGDE